MAGTELTTASSKMFSLNGQGEHVTNFNPHLPIAQSSSAGGILFLYKIKDECVHAHGPQYASLHILSVYRPQARW